MMLLFVPPQRVRVRESSPAKFACKGLKEEVNRVDVILQVALLVSCDGAPWMRTPGYDANFYRIKVCQECIMIDLVLV